jgi:hypothetical protein
MFGSRVIVHTDRMHNLGEHKEHEFVDARVEKTFQQITRPFAEITNDDDALRLTLINEQLNKLVANKPVSDKLMRLALTVEQMQSFLVSVETPTHLSELNYGDGMPDELHAYNIMLRSADFQYNKFDKMSLQQVRGRKFKHGVVTNESNKADSLYEDALERLHEIWDLASPSHRYRLQCWFDREIDFDKGYDTKISIDCDSIARVRGSRSKKAQDSGLPKLSKRLKRKECQLIALRDAVIDIVFVAEIEQVEEFTSKEAQIREEERRARLNALINNLPGDDI